MKRLRRAWVIVLLVIIVVAAGCGGGRKRRIAVIPKGTSHLFWVSVQAGAIAAGDDHNVEILWNGPATETDYGRQIQIVDSMTAQHVDGIALAANERKALVAAAERAASAGIPVTIFDSGLDWEGYVTFVATNNVDAGKLAARELAGLLGGKGDVAIVAHAPGSYSTMEREDGFREAMQREFPGIRIVAEQFGMSDRAKARAAAENMLTGNPDINGMFASTEPSSMGISLALKARELAGKIKFVGFDSSEAMIEDLRSGVIHALVVQDPFKIGYEAVRSLVDKLNGADPPKHMDLSARVVRAADLSKPEIQRLLSPDVQKYLNQ